MRAILTKGSKIEGVQPESELTISNVSHDTLEVLYKGDDGRMKRMLVGHPEITFLLGNNIHITGFVKAGEGLFSRIRFTISIG